MLIDPSAKKVILCIDDDPSILMYETALFERQGYAVLSAASGQEGLWRVATSHCDAVVLYYEMPWINGYDVAFELKLRRPDLVIVLLSASDVPTRALALVDAVVLKLEASRQLLPMVAELCSRSLDTKTQTSRRLAHRSVSKGSTGPPPLVQLRVRPALVQAQEGENESQATCYR
jgi:CheY-like chemotaxis protein